MKPPEIVLQLFYKGEELTLQYQLPQAIRKRRNCISRALVTYSLLSKAGYKCGIAEFPTNYRDLGRQIIHYVCVYFRHGKSGYYFEYGNPLFYTSTTAYFRAWKHNLQWHNGDKISLTGFNGFLDLDAINRLKSVARNRGIFLLEGE